TTFAWLKRPRTRFRFLSSRRRSSLRCAPIRSAVVLTRRTCNRLRDALQPISRCRDLSLRCVQQRDRDARAQGRFPRGGSANRRVVVSLLDNAEMLKDQKTKNAT